MGRPLEGLSVLFDSTRHVTVRSVRKNSASLVK
jgi:hypothetical protein